MASSFGCECFDETIAPSELVGEWHKYLLRNRHRRPRSCFDRRHFRIRTQAMHFGAHNPPTGWGKAPKAEQGPKCDGLQGPAWTCTYSARQFPRFGHWYVFFLFYFFCTTEPKFNVLAWIVYGILMSTFNLLPLSTNFGIWKKYKKISCGHTWTTLEEKSHEQSFMNS